MINPGVEMIINPGVETMINPDVVEDFQIPDEIWAFIIPLLPPEKTKKKSGRPRMDDHKAMNAIFYVLRTGIQWKALPKTLGASSTVHER